MIILDTNVLSALMQQQPDPQVVAWLDRQAAGNIETRGGGMRQRPSGGRQRKKKQGAEKDVRPPHPPNKRGNGADA